MHTEEDLGRKNGKVRNDVKHVLICDKLLSGSTVGV